MSFTMAPSKLLGKLKRAQLWNVSAFGVFMCQQLLQALGCYDEIVHKFPDLAITEYARIHRAILLYQTGNPSRAILELEDEEVNLRGFAEVSLIQMLKAPALGQHICTLLSLFPSQYQ